MTASIGLIRTVLCRSVTAAGIVILVMANSCIDQPLRQQQQPAADIEGEAGETAARLYLPRNPHTVELVSRLGFDGDVERISAAFAAQGYLPAPAGNLVMSGSTGGAGVEVTMLCFGNRIDPGRDVLYLAVIDTGGSRGITAARLLSEPASRIPRAAAPAGRMWLETLPIEHLLSDPAAEGAPEGASARWVWDEYWTCVTSIIAAGAAGCAVSCVPMIPMGYMVCYFSCVGGVAVAAVIRCLIQQLSE